MRCFFKKLVAYDETNFQDSQIAPVLYQGCIVSLSRLARNVFKIHKLRDMVKRYTNQNPGVTCIFPLTPTLASHFKMFLFDQEKHHLKFLLITLLTARKRHKPAKL